MPVIQYLPVSRENPASTYLRAAAKNVTSQNGEDGVIARIFGIAGVANKFCCEFGAWDGVHLSNTWNLIVRNGWRALLVEGSAEKFPALQATYADRPDLTLVNAFVGTEGENSLDALLERAGAPRDFDFLSIDVDGMDWHIWKGLARHRPRVVVIEFNATIPNDVIFIQDADPDVNQGNSLLAMIALGKEKGYELVATTPGNAFFVERALYPQFRIPDNSIDAMHTCAPLETKIFQLFDGTLMLAGHQRLNWRDQAIDVEQIQVVPKHLRRF